jgi:hypothetical protein
VRTTDIKALGELAGEALAAGGGFIKEMYEGVADRPFEIPGAATGWRSGWRSVAVAPSQ